jgi:hypothetical protein
LYGRLTREYRQTRLRLRQGPTLKVVL